MHAEIQNTAKEKTDSSAAKIIPRGFPKVKSEGLCDKTLKDTAFAECYARSPSVAPPEALVGEASRV